MRFDARRQVVDELEWNLVGRQRRGAFPQQPAGSVQVARLEREIDRVNEALAPLEPYLRGAPPGLPFTFDIDTLESGIRSAAPFLEEIGAPATNPLTDPEFIEFMQEFLDSDAEGLDLIGEFLGVIGPNLLEPIMVPDAFGAVIFCILDAQGTCPDGEVEPPPGEPIEPGGEARPAQPIVAAPSFTG